MLLKDLSFSSPHENILYDEVLLSLAEKGEAGEVLRFWESAETFVVLGRTSVVEDDVDMAAVRRDKVPVLRRHSGGGTVVQGRGCLNYSLILSKESRPGLNDLRRSYEEILSLVIEALSVLKVQAVFQPISDLALAKNQKKFSGNAQHRGRKFILHHGTILYDFDLGLISKYLKMPKSVPDYRGNRSHQEFVTNIPLTVGPIKQSLKKNFSIQAEENFLIPLEQEKMREILPLTA